MSVNFLLRFAWTLSILPARFNPYWSASTHQAMFDDWQYEMIFLPSLVLAELARRMLWLLLRVEHEHWRLWQRFAKYQYSYLYFRPTAHAAPQLLHSTYSSTSVHSAVPSYAATETDVLFLEGHGEHVHGFSHPQQHQIESSISTGTLEFVVVTAILMIFGAIFILW
jgi:hypothetical protein